MSKIVAFPAPRQAPRHAHRQASEWLAEVHAGVSDYDREQLKQWLAEDPSHIEAFLEVAGWWDQFNVLSELSDLFPLEEQDVSAAQEGRQRWRKPRVASAVLVSMALAAIVAMNLYKLSERMLTASSPIIYSTEVGEQSGVLLPDGSEVLLNTDTVIELDYSSEERKVVLLRGEGHFSVSQERKARPFRVDVGGRVIEATGTAFSAYRTGEGGLHVTVTEGAVHILSLDSGGALVSQDGPQPTVEQEGVSDDAVNPAISEGGSRGALIAALTAGEQARIGEDLREGITVVQLGYEEIEAKLAWRHGRLLFQDEPLREVVAEVSRYTRTQLTVDPAIGEQPVTGYYQAGDVERLLVALERNFGVGVRHISENEILLVPQ